MYPASGVLRKILPTLTNYTVTKFDPSEKYGEEQEVHDENGLIKYVVGIDKKYEYDIEMVVKPSASIPEPLTTLVFTAPSGGVTFPGTVSGNITILIRGEVKIIGKAGEAAMIGFKGMVNANIP